MNFKKNIFNLVLSVIIIFTISPALGQTVINKPKTESNVLKKDTAIIKEKNDGNYTTLKIKKLNEVNKFDEIQMPPLDLLLQTCYQSPNVRKTYAIKKQRINELKTQKRDWTNYISGYATYQYGNLYANTNTEESAYGTSIQYTGSTTSNYNLGARLTIPLNTIWDRHNKLEEKRNAIESADNEYLENIQSMKLTIIRLYYNAIKYYNSLQSLSEALIIGKANIKITEEDYINGKKGLNEVERARSYYSGNVMNFESTRNDLIETLKELEIFTQIKIIY